MITPVTDNKKLLFKDLEHSTAQSINIEKQIDSQYQQLHFLWHPVLESTTFCSARI